MKNWLLKGIDRQINNACALLLKPNLMIERGTNPEILEQDIAWTLNLRKAVAESNISE